MLPEQQIGKALMALGSAIVLIGALLYFSRGIPFLGKLPGDIRLEGKSFGVYFPITTCLFISLFLSALFFLLSKWR